MSMSGVALHCAISARMSDTVGMVFTSTSHVGRSRSMKTFVAGVRRCTIVRDIVFLCVLVSVDVGVGGEQSVQNLPCSMSTPQRIHVG